VKEIEPPPTGIAVAGVLAINTPAQTKAVVGGVEEHPAVADATLLIVNGHVLAKVLLVGIPKAWAAVAGPVTGTLIEPVFK
jgi:hypothetical protein